MGAPFGQDQMAESARVAVEALKGKEAPLDRSFKYYFPEHLTQEWIDELVIQAHLTTPIWSDYALVNNRPDIWGMAAYTANGVEDRIVLVADDCLVIASNDRVEMLITATPVAVSESIHYQIGFHCFAVSLEVFIYASSFRELTQAHGILAYPDSDLIDELGLWQSGRGAEAYIAHEARTRPIFIFRKSTHLPNRAHKYQRSARAFCSGFGPVIVNDGLFNAYREHLSDRKFGMIAIAPGQRVFPLERSSAVVPDNFTDLLSHSELSAPILSQSDGASLGASALSAWSPLYGHPPRLVDLRDAGEHYRQIWEELLSRFAPPTSTQQSAEAKFAEQLDFAEAPDEPQVSNEVFASVERVEPLKLDADGYPVDASDISQWADANFGDRIVIAPRARRALTKSRHPEPRRIAEALEVLAGPKWRGYLGETETVAEFEAGLLKLRMRDGFSNAERLKGQTGADYILDHGGRRLLLERHLRSNSSGFNDPRMIRIYYVFDKLLRKIVVGWLPGHLRTSQS